MKKNIIKTVCFLLILALLLAGTTEFLMVNNSGTVLSMRGFKYEKENSLDVVFLGQSEVYTGFIPTQAWEEQGFTSYCYGLAGTPASAIPAIVKEIAKTQNPKVLVIEVTAFSKKPKYYDDMASMHMVYDELSWGSDRDEAIKTSIPEDRQKEFYMPLSTYHNNWKNPRNCVSTLYVKLRSDLARHSAMKGYISQTKVIKKYSKYDIGFRFKNIDKYWLDETIKACKEANIENVIFVRFPHFRKIKYKKDLKAMEKYINDAGYEFINCNNNYKTTKIKKKKDFYNVDHMNVYGAEKFTKYFAKLLKERYDLNTEHDQDTIDTWNDDAIKVEEILDKGKKWIKEKKKRFVFEYSLY